MGITKPLHPIGFSLFPVLSLYSANLGLIPLSDAVRPSLVVVAMGLALWGLLSLVMRSVERAAAVTSVFVLEFFTFSFIWDPIKKSSLIASFADKPADFLWIWIPLALIPLFLLGRKWAGYAKITQVFNVVALGLVLAPTLSIAVAKLQTQRDLQQLKVQSATGKGSRIQPPDIYYIILDGYGRADELKHYFNLDNSAFLKALQDRGFYVANQSRSNYCQTELSLPSALNLNFIDKVMPANVSVDDYRYELDRLVDDNYVSRYLRGKDYQYIAVTSGFPGFHPRKANLWLNEDVGFSLFESALIGNTPIRASSEVAKSQFVGRRKTLNAAFEHLKNLGTGGDQPRFVFAHILAPHPPFVFGPNGEPVKSPRVPYGLWDGSHYFAVGGTLADYTNGYAGQLQYVNKQMIPVIDAILKNSKVPPIIIIQGDHGSRAHLDHESLANTDARESFRNLNAYLVPANVREGLYPGITPVNSFRVLLDRLFGEKFPLLPDTSFYTTWERPDQPIDVTKKAEASY